MHFLSPDEFYHYLSTLILNRLDNIYFYLRNSFTVAFYRFLMPLGNMLTWCFTFFNKKDTDLKHRHGVKSVQIRGFFFGPNTAKYRLEKTPYLEHFSKSCGKMIVHMMWNLYWEVKYSWAKIQHTYVWM